MAACQEDDFELNENVDPWITKMTMEQASLIRTRAQKIKENDPASTIRVQDDTLLRAPETEHTETEKKMHKQCYDALING
eukprot:5223041-Heterocapsa_arctica.AAC.1